MQEAVETEESFHAKFYMTNSTDAKVAMCNSSVHCLQAQHALVKTTSFGADCNNEGDCDVLLVCLQRGRPEIRNRDANEN